MNFSHKYLFLFLISFNSITAMQRLANPLKYLPFRRLANLKTILTTNKLNPIHVNNCVNRRKYIFNQNIIFTRNFSNINFEKIIKKVTDSDFYDLDSKIDTLINSVKKDCDEISYYELNLALKYLNPDFNLSRRAYLAQKANYKKLLLQCNDLAHGTFGKNLLFNAVFISDEEMVLLLLKLGIDINQTIEIIDNEEIPILNFADDNIKAIIKLHEKYYLKTY